MLQLVFQAASTIPEGLQELHPWLQETELYQDAEANMILSKPSDIIENKEVCLLLISDGAYQAISLQL